MKENIIAYERIVGEYDPDTIKDLFKEIITKGQEIIYYNEKQDIIRHQLKGGGEEFEYVIHVTMVVAKKQQTNIL